MMVESWSISSTRRITSALTSLAEKNLRQVFIRLGHGQVMLLLMYTIRVRTAAAVWLAGPLGASSAFFRWRLRVCFAGTSHHEDAGAVRAIRASREPSHAHGFSAFADCRALRAAATVRITSTNPDFQNKGSIL
jgi:hypothetical protein